MVYISEYRRILAFSYDRGFFPHLGEDRSMPTLKGFGACQTLLFASLAHQVEHAAVNRRVVGSNPTGGAKQTVLPSRYRGGNAFN